MRRRKEIGRRPGYRMPRTAPIAKRGKQYAKRVARSARFYASAAWKKIRLETFRLADFRCALCPYRDDSETGAGLVCDHTSYARFGGGEIPGEDTRALCDDCHNRITPQTRANHAQGLHNRRKSA